MAQPPKCKRCQKKHWGTLCPLDGPRRFQESDHERSRSDVAVRPRPVDPVKAPEAPDPAGAVEAEKPAEVPGVAPEVHEGVSGEEGGLPANRRWELKNADAYREWRKRYMKLYMEKYREKKKRESSESDKE